MASKVSKRDQRKSRQKRVRAKVFGTPDRPRLNIYRSLNNTYAQIIDDVSGNTIVSASSLEEGVKAEFKHTGNVATASVIGQLVAERALEKGITTIVFDRAGYKYHGRVKALAEAAREKGLVF
ncbi:MAG: 50S ribosomal protein L18 [Bacillota bacterium]|nr:50S ribosomal protein L18 [Bacillota bacterium]